MTTKIEIFNNAQLKRDLPNIRSGDVVRIHQKIKEVAKKDKSSKEQENKERIQVFEGIVIAKKHGKGISGTITVRKVISGVGAEKVFPIHSPLIEKIEVVRHSKVRKAKLYYLRGTKGKKIKLKRKEFAEAIAEPASIPSAVINETIENKSVSDNTDSETKGG